jgi:hypothetical protein
MRIEERRVEISSDGKATKDARKRDPISKLSVRIETLNSVLWAASFAGVSKKSSYW